MASAVLTLVILFFIARTVYSFIVLNNTGKNQAVTAAEKNAIYVMAGGYCVFVAAFVVIIYLLLKNKRLKDDAEERFTEAKNMAEDAKHSKAQFLTTMTNELRQPLNRVLSNASALIQSDLKEVQKNEVNGIHRDSITLLSIVNDSLDFFKIESGKLEIESNQFVLRLVLEEVIQILVSDSRQIQITYDIDPNIPAYIKADLARIRQVLMNLIGNAVQINDTGEIKLYAELINKQDEIMILQFKIADTGDKKEGSDLTLESVDQMKYVSHYTGLGLSVAARLVALMGGAIKIESTSASGTVFTFTIKVKKITETTNMNTATGIIPEKIDKELFKRFPLRILAADDNEISQMVLSSMLFKMGYNCEIVQNGSEAVNKAIESEYDLIFMDMFMPEMDGLEATRRIREYYLKNDHPIIIALTSNALEEKETFLQAGINDFVTKPFKPKDLEQIIIQSCSN